MNSLKHFAIAGITAVYLFSATGCKKDSADTSMALPPEGSMVMDASFTSTQKSLNATSYAGLTNYQYASLAVVTWTTAAAYYTAVPTAAFQKALQQKPVYNDTIKAWVWKYQVTYENASYEAKLTGKASTDSVQWNMYITKTGDNYIKSYLWFTGKSSIGRTGGWWTLNYPMVVNNQLTSEGGIYIKWNYTSDKVKSLQFISIANKKWDATTSSFVTNDNKGGYIKFGLKDDATYDAYYNIYNAKELNLYEIVWNTTSKAGQLKFNGNVYGCWDSNRVNKATCN